MIAIQTESDLQISLGYYVVYFWATWYPTCNRMTKNLISLEKDFTEVKFYSVDIDFVPKLKSKYKINFIPTTNFIKNGETFERIEGVSLITPMRKILRNMTKEIKE